MSDLDTARRLAELRSHRNAVIEQCARVAESMDTEDSWRAAKAIRALKDKP